MSLNITIPTPKQPEKNPNRRWSSWSIKEIYTGPDGTGAYVPNVEDLVWDRNSGWYEVASVDYSTGLSILVPLNMAKTGTGATEDDSLLVAGPGAFSQTYVLLVDTSVTPHVVKFDHRFFIPGSTAAYIKIFKTANISNGGDVISAMFDSAGAMVSENIPLEKFYHGTNLQRPRTGYLTERVENGDLVSVVIYDRDGSKTGVIRMAVSLTNSIRDLNADFNYVTSIELISEFVSKSDANMIEIPHNMNIDSTLIKGRVNYLGKPSVILPIDESKFMLHGTKAFVSTVPNQVGDLVLSYKVGNNENAYGTTADGVISRAYRIKTINADLRYSLKLFAIPYWNVNKWALKWYLTNLDRSILFDVTDKVAVATGSKAYDGNPENKTIQSIQVSINWSQVAAGNAYHHHVQNLKIKNNVPANEQLAKTANRDVNSYVIINYSDDIGFYNENVSAKATKVGVNNFTMNISNGQVDIENWLDNHYYKLAPLQLDSGEYQAPKPTHVRLSCNDFYRVIPIDKVLQDIENVNLVGNNVQGLTLTMEFIEEAGVHDVELGVGYMIIQQVT